MARERADSGDVDVEPTVETPTEDEPTQDDMDAAVAAHNDAEIAKAKEALEEPNPK